WPAMGACWCGRRERKPSCASWWKDRTGKPSTGSPARLRTWCRRNCRRRRRPRRETGRRRFAFWEQQANRTRSGWLFLAFFTIRTSFFAVSRPENRWMWLRAGLGKHIMMIFNRKQKGGQRANVFKRLNSDAGGARPRRGSSPACPSWPAIDAAWGTRRGSRIRVDEVEVFGVFGGDLPATTSLPRVGRETGAGDRANKIPPGCSATGHGRIRACCPVFHLGRKHHVRNCRIHREQGFPADFAERFEKTGIPGV